MSAVSASAKAAIGHGAVSRRRRIKDRIFTILLWTAGGLAVLPLVFIAGYVVVRGVQALNIPFFTKTPEPPGVPDQGIVQAFIGSGIIIGLAMLFSIPLGLLSAVYLAEYGRGRLADGIRFVADILLSTPSIIAGAFIWAMVVLTLGSFSALAAGIALTVLMWPLITRATEEILRLVPNDLREGGLALGLPKWRVILRVVVPTAGAGIFTAIMLAMARGLGETAPILLTALGNDFINVNITQPTDAVPLRIYNYARSPYPDYHTIGWGGALVLLVVVLGLSITARVISTRQQRRSR
jgi:phosphate transport system permease protein